MANEAHKEPTMEEILASIRKIISDDSAEAAPVAREKSVEDFTVVSNEALPELEPDAGVDLVDIEVPEQDNTLDEDIFADSANNDVIETLDDFAQVETEVASLAVDEADEAIAVQEEEIESMVKDIAPAVEDAPPSFEEMMAKPTIAEQPEQADAPSGADTLVTETEITEETPAMDVTTQSAANDSLLDNDTVSVAAGALDKLKVEAAPPPKVAEVDEQGQKSLEALTREIMKPLIKEWLDSNLASIVEERVDEEVRRIAGNAR